jgi:hypothetical protein
MVIAVGKKTITDWLCTSYGNKTENSGRDAMSKCTNQTTNNETTNNETAQMNAECYRTRSE